MDKIERLKKYRFKKGNPGGGHTKKHPNGYLLPILKKLLNTKIDITDPVTEKTIKKFAKNAIMEKLICNAACGDNTAIKEIFERVDGKVKDKTEHSLDDETKKLLGNALNRLD